MKRIKLLLVAVFALVGATSFAQEWKGVRFSYDHTFVNLDWDDAEDIDYNGFSLGYVQSFGIAKAPLFIETGIGMNYARYNDDEGVGESTSNLLAFSVPVNFVVNLISASNCNSRVTNEYFVGFSFLHDSFVP